MYDTYYDFCAPIDQIAEDLPPLIQNSDIDFHTTSDDATLHEQLKLVSYSEYQRKQSSNLQTSRSDSSSSRRSIREAKWQDMYAELKKFKSYEGHCNVPYRCDKHHPKLGAWVSTQRRNYKNRLKNKKPCLSKHHYHLLDDVGFSWKVSPSGGPKLNNGKWRENFERLKKFKATHGHCCVPQNYPENPKLGAWVHNQRTELRKIMMLRGCCVLSHQPSHVMTIGSSSSSINGKSKMTDDRVRALEAIGFVWKDQTSRYEHDDSSWMKRVQELLDYKSLHGHFRVPCHVPEYRVMKNWIKKQRYNYRLYVGGRSESSMTERRKRMLDDIDFMRLSTFGSSSSGNLRTEENKNKMTTFDQDDDDKECHSNHRDKNVRHIIEDEKLTTTLFDSKETYDIPLFFEDDDMKDDLFFAM